jgi:hypothetical protein
LTQSFTDAIGLGILDRSWLMNNVVFVQHGLELMSDAFGTLVADALRWTWTW